MENYLNRLADLILKEIEKRGCSCICFADLCGISRNEMGRIVNRKKTDIKLSTILKICENSEISVENIFQAESPEIENLEVWVKHNNKLYKFCFKAGK